MKTPLVRLSVVALLLLPCVARCQSISVGIGSGILAVQSPDFYTRATTDPGIYSVNGLFSHSGGLDFHTELQLRTLVDCYIEAAHVGVSAEFTYAFLRGSGSTYFPYSEILFPAALTTKLDLWSLGLVGRFYFLRASVSPFLSAAGRMNRFGELRFRFDDDGFWTEDNSTKPFDRFNVGLGGGCDIQLFSAASARVECQHSWNNIDGHKDGEGQFRSVDVSLTILYTIWY